MLHRAGQVADELFAKGIPESDLTPRQYAVLVALAENENISQTDLVNATGIDRSTLAEIVKRLTARGLLQRRRSRHDARAYAVRLSAEGHVALQAARPKVLEIEESLVKDLHPDRRAELLAALSTLVNGPVGASDKLSVCN
jgi:DNA-binding MarR family transcriptional regulator